MAGDPGLFGGDDDAEGPEEDAPSMFSDALAAAGSPRPAHRPKGSRNRRSVEFEKWYHAMGFKDPARFLAELVSADPLALQQLVPGKHKLDVLKVQVAAAAELMPYLHGKKPISIDLGDGVLLPTLIIAAGTNQLDQAQQIRDQRALSIGSPIVESEASEIKDLEGDK